MQPMRLIAKVIRLLRAKFHYNRPTAVQDIQDYASLIFWHTMYLYILVCICHSVMNSLSRCNTNRAVGEEATMTSIVISQVQCVQQQQHQSVTSLTLLSCTVSGLLCVPHTVTL